MRKNEYLYDMLKSEEHAQEILVSQLNAEKRARRAAEKKAHDAEFRVSSLLDKIAGLHPNSMHIWASFPNGTPKWFPCSWAVGRSPFRTPSGNRLSAPSVRNLKTF